MGARIRLRVYPVFFFFSTLFHPKVSKLINWAKMTFDTLVSDAWQSIKKELSEEGCADRYGISLWRSYRIALIVKKTCCWLEK